MKEKILLSIIVPVYNVEKYLIECINSIINNNFRNYELILIDDGSTDRSGQICDRFAKKYSKLISVIHKKNGGLSSARNEGIKLAKGKYLMFIDSDDRINMINFDKIFSKDADIIQYKSVYYYEKTKKYIHLKNIDINCKNDDINQILIQKISNGTLSIAAWDKIVKRDLIINNNLYFKEGLLSEDIDWSLELYLYSKKIIAYNDEIYIYRQQRDNSITSTTSNNIITSSIYIFDKWFNYNYSSDEIRKIYMNYLAYLYTIIITKSNKDNTSEEQKKYILNHKDILKYRKNYKVKLCSFVINLFGFNIGIRILRIYLLLKNKGIMKI